MKSKSEQAAIYAKLKGASVSRNYEIRMALKKGEPIPPPPRLPIYIVRGVSAK